MEQQILNQVSQSIGKAIETSLSGYNNPLQKLCEEVISKHKADLFAVIDAEVCQLKDSPEFRSAVKDALNHKLAKLMVSKMEGELEKQVNELRARPEVRAQIVLAVKAIVDSATNTKADALLAALNGGA